MKKGFLIFLIFTGTASMAIAWLKNTFPEKKFLSEPVTVISPRFHRTVHIEKLSLNGTAAKNFITEHNFNQGFCFLVDMSLPSGQSRFFVYDPQHDKVLDSGLVTHGRCNEEWLKGRRYNNNIGSGCTSLGKYRIGKPYKGRFGLAFKLYGLDQSNSNAFTRYVVLHSHRCVPEHEIPDEICQSDGCPTVAPVFLKKLSRMITSSSKPVLLWIFQ